MRSTSEKTFAHKNLVTLDFTVLAQLQQNVIGLKQAIATTIKQNPHQNYSASNVTEYAAIRDKIQIGQQQLQNLEKLKCADQSNFSYDLKILGIALQTNIDTADIHHTEAIIMSCDTFVNYGLLSGEHFCYNGYTIGSGNARHELELNPLGTFESSHKIKFSIITGAVSNCPQIDLMYPNANSLSLSF